MKGQEFLQRKENHSAWFRICFAGACSYVLQTMYGAVDMLVVGQFAQAADVAVSTGSWLMQLITAFVVGIAMGTPFFFYGKKDR